MSLPELRSGLQQRATADQWCLPCQRHDAELWFAESPADIARAKTLCASCPLQAACLDGAQARREHAGVWGGQLFVEGTIVAFKRGRGRPRKQETLGVG